MCYEVAIASSLSNETTFAKLFIISLEGAAANWYAKLQPRSIHSWHHLKEKFIVNFQGFQVELNTEEDFLSCQQYEKESLAHFFQRFLPLMAQAPEVSDDQVIMQAIKALRTWQLHSHLVREHLRALKELYNNFPMLSKLEVLHFQKLEQHKKVPKENEASRPTKYNRARESTISSIIQPIKSATSTLTIAGLQKIGRKILGLCNQSIGTEPSTLEKIITIREEVTRARDEVMGEAKTNHYIACITKETQTTCQEIVQSS
jgi:hypothetical protein